MNRLPLGMALEPPATPWGINFGGGLNSTALIIECRRRKSRELWAQRERAALGRRARGYRQRARREPACDHIRGSLPSRGVLYMIWLYGIGGIVVLIVAFVCIGAAAPDKDDKTLSGRWSGI